MPPRCQFAGLVILIVVVNLLASYASHWSATHPAANATTQTANAPAAPSTSSGGSAPPAVPAQPVAAAVPFKPGLWAVGAWLMTLVLLIGCFAIIGMIPTGQPPVKDWRGVLIDQRNRISLSRFQLVLWTLLVVSAIVTEGTFNAFWRIDDPLGLAIPKELWILLGLSSATAVAAPVVLATKNPDGAADNALSTKDPGEHAWRDMFYGDDKGNDDQVDFSKVQQFFLTVVLIVIYGIEIGAILMSPAVPPGETKMSIRMFFPALDAGFLGLMAVSQVAYISYKALPQNKTDAAKP